MQKANEIQDDPYPDSWIQFWTPATGWFYRALANYQLGQQTQAELWHYKAVDRSEELLREHDDGTGPRLPWHKRLMYQRLRREVETLIVDMGAKRNVEAREKSHPKRREPITDQ